MSSIETLQTTPSYGNFLLASIKPAMNNRKRFDEKKMAELAASVKAKGIIQPIVIRPVERDITQDAAEITYEIVAGERRWRAAGLAGLSEVPAMVRVLSDKEAKEFQVLENLQREDVHPLEEAEGYQELMMKHGYNADQLAEQVHKSRAYIYAKLKLCDLSLNARQAFYDDKLSESTALLVARIPVPALQLKAIEEIAANDDPMSYRDAAQFLKSRYMLRLDAAPFPTNDAKLLALVGSCTKCPKRTGNQPEIFADIKEPNICTDPDCFAEKRAANDTKKIADAYKKGIPVLEGDEAKKARGLAEGFYNSNLVPADAKSWSFERKRPDMPHGAINQLISEDKFPPPATILKNNDGTITPLFDKTAIQVALEKAGLLYTLKEHTARMKEKLNKSTKTDGAANIERELKEQQAKDETLFRLAVYKKLRERGFTGFSLESLREFVKLMVCDYNYDLANNIVEELYPFEPNSSNEIVCAYIDQASIGDVQLMLVDLVLGSGIRVSHYDLADLGGEDDLTFNTVLKMVQHENIDADEIRRAQVPPSIVDEPNETQSSEDVKKAATPKRAKKAEAPESNTNGAWPFPKIGEKAVEV